ncbi:hypothetical protein FRC12_016511 [Ceratobasidium sp. 428]|nr:hypothetical protein FRC12_016511 [Ceratobasidium sp. 428]
MKNRPFNVPLYNTPNTKLAASRYKPPPLPPKACRKSVSVALPYLHGFQPVSLTTNICWASALKATYKTTKWEETGVTSTEDAPIKVVRVRTEREFKGGIVGKGVAEYLICHHAESKCLTGPYAGKPTSSFTGACYFKGSIDGSEEGEVVFWTTKGSFGSVLEAEWTIDEKTALGGLKGLKGHGGYRHEIKEGCFLETEIWLSYQS